MSNMRRHARVHTNAVVDTPTEGERPLQAGASGANPDTSSQDMPPSRGSGWRAGLTRGSISSRGRSSSFSGPGSPNDIEMEMAEERESLQHSHLPTPVDPHIVSRSHTFHPSGASSIPHVGSSIRPFLESVHLCDRTRWVCHPASPPCSPSPEFSAQQAVEVRATRSDGCIFVRSFSLAHSYSLSTQEICVSLAHSHDDC
jgi:hypothetical protein